MSEEKELAEDEVALPEGEVPTEVVEEEVKEPTPAEQVGIEE